MKTLTPNFNLLESEKTPEYSTHVAPVRLPLHVRERGHEFVAFHATKREMASSFHTSEDVFEKLASARIVAPFSHSHEEQIVEARLVTDEDAFAETGDFISDFVAPESLPFPEVWGEYEVVVPLEIDDEAECEDEILLSPPRMTYAVADVVSREKPPFIFIDDLETL